MSLIEEKVNDRYEAEVVMNRIVFHVAPIFINYPYHEFVYYTSMLKRRRTFFHEERTSNLEVEEARLTGDSKPARSISLETPFRKNRRPTYASSEGKRCKKGKHFR